MDLIILFFLKILPFFSVQEKHTDLVLFSSDRSGNSDIYLLSPKSSTTKQITYSDAEEWAATWVNSTEISFLRQKGKVITRHLINIETGIESELQHPVNCRLDDKNILYSAEGNLQLYPCGGDIYLFNREDSSTLNLTEGISGTSSYPSWSFDGNQITFTNNQSGSNDIYVMDLNSREMTQLTHFHSNEERGALSPNNEFLVFSSDHFETGNQDILIMNLETKELRNITSSVGTELIARWNSDGTSLYFGSNQAGNWEIYVYDLKDQSTQRLTFHEGFDGDPRIF